MADTAPVVQGTSTATTGTAPDAPDDADEPKYTEAQMQAAIKDRLRNLKKANAKLEADLADLRKKATTEPVEDESEDDEPTATATATPQDAAARKARIEAARAKKEREAWEAERKTLTEKATAAEAALKATTIQHAAMDALSTREDVQGTADVLELTTKRLTINDEGKVVAATEDGGETPLSVFYDEWLKKHPNFVKAPPSGTGDRPGRAATKGAKSPGEMTEGEAYRDGVVKHFGKHSK